MRGSGAGRASAAVSILAASLLVGLNAWIAAGVFGPLLQADASDDRVSARYVLVSPSYTWLVAAIGVAVVVLTWLHVARFRRSLDTPNNPDDSDDGVGPRPLALGLIGWTVLSLLPLFVLVSRFASGLTAVSYVLFDLSPYWWAGLAAVAVLPSLRPAWMDRRAVRIAVLVSVPIAFAIASTPALRFTGTLHGDEPKYMRYCESFFQGHGFDVSKNRKLTELPDHRSHLLGNVRAFARAVPEEALLLWRDVRRLVIADSVPRLVSGPPSAGMFFEGKHPGTLYQLHNPGLSFLLFPGYFLDRIWTGSGLGYQDEFPDSMPGMYAMALLLFAAYTVSLYWLLRSASPPSRACLLAVLGATLLPSTAFVFQLYPEVPAGAILFFAVRWLTDADRGGSGRTGLIGGLTTGFLPWLHVRFSAAAIICLGWALFVSTRRRPSRWLFAAGTMAGLASVSLYTYRLTGSLLPVATYGSDLPLSIGRVLHGLPAFAFDGVWGLFPHAPLYLLALAGLPLTWRRWRSGTLLVLFLIAAVAVPAAGHGFWAAGATPGRYLVSVAPMLLIFVGDALAAWNGHRWFRALVVALALVSIETSVVYNLHHVKQIGPLVTLGFSGWRPNLLFPSLGAEQWTATSIDVVLLSVWILAALAIIAVVSRMAVRPTTPRLPSRLVDVAGVFAVLFALAAAGQVVAAASGRSRAAEYLMPARETRARALTLYASLPRCALCYVSGDGFVDPSRALDNAPTFADIQVRPDTPKNTVPVRLRIRPRSAAGDFIVSTVRIDFGDGQSATLPRQFGDVDVQHVYAEPGEYQLVAVIRAPGGETFTKAQLLPIAP